MPIYEYECNACRADFELLIRGAEVPECPACQSKNVNKLLSLAAAPKSSSHSLPIAGQQPASSAGCGLAQCGGGRCQFD